MSPDPNQPPAPTCPTCARPLIAMDTTQHPDSAPWLCPIDARGFWAAELTPQVRARWDPVLRSFNDVDGAIRHACAVERNAARTRTNLRPLEEASP